MPRSEAALSRLRRKLALRTRFQAALDPELWVAARKELSKTPSAAAPEPDRESVRLLTASPLFDAIWYTKVSGEDRRKDAAVRHYLTLGRAAGLSPHPLFDPDYFGGQHAASIGTRDPLVLYLAKRSSRSASPHPLFDLEAYVERVPAAMGHPLGPLGHYMDIGAADGVPPNDWYVPDPQREPGGLISWIEARATDWVNRRRAPAVPEPDAPVEAAAASDRPGRLLDQGQETAVGSPRVSIVLVVGDDVSLVPAMVDSVRRQTIPDWELLIVHADDDVDWETQVGGFHGDPRIRLAQRNGDRVSALVVGLERATGDAVAWISAGDRWDERRLERVLAALALVGVDSVHDQVELQSGTEDATASLSGAVPVWPGKPALAGGTLTAPPEWMAMGWHPELAGLVVRRKLALEVGGFDPTVHRAAAHDFFLKVAARTRLVLIPQIGVHGDADRRKQDVAVPPVRERPSLDLPSIQTWHDVVLKPTPGPLGCVARTSARPRRRQRGHPDVPGLADDHGCRALRRRGGQRERADRPDDRRRQRERRDDLRRSGVLAAAVPERPGPQQRGQPRFRAWQQPCDVGR